MNLVQETFLELLEAARPDRLLCVADAPVAAAETWRRRHDGCVLERLPPGDALAALADRGRYDYALVKDALERLETGEAESLLARIRDLHCPRFALACVHADGEPWTPGRLLSLSLSLHRRVNEDGREIGVYTYDIDTANPEREWNNPEDWAHPQNFDRYRW